MAKFWLEIKKEANCLGALLKNVPPLLHAVDHTAGDNWFAFRKLLDLSRDCEAHAEKPSNVTQGYKCASSISWIEYITQHVEYSSNWIITSNDP